MLEIQIIRKDTHNLEQITKEMQMEKWDTAEQGAELLQLTKFVAEPKNFLLVAYSDGKVVGALVAYLLLRMDNRKRDMYVDELETKKEFRRQGVATAMLEKIAEIAKEENCYELWVGAELDDLPANKLYENFPLKKVVEKANSYTYSLT